MDASAGGDEVKEDYDVVIDTLQKQRDILWKMTQQNMNADMFNIMDQIRLEQIDQLDKAMIKHKKHLSLQKTESGELVAVTYTDDEHRIIEVLWEKNK
jgi:hypothetical protein